MTIDDAMRNLGHDSRAYFGRLSQLPKKDRILLAEKFLIKIKQDAKSLMVKYHPDKGGRHEDFVKISSSLDFIEKETNQFIMSLKTKIEEEKEKSELRGYIRIGDQ